MNIWLRSVSNLTGILCIYILCHWSISQSSKIFREVKPVALESNFWNPYWYWKQGLSEMTTVKTDEKSHYLQYLRIAQFYNSLIDRKEYQLNLPAILLQKFIESGIDVNFRIPTESRTVLYGENCVGYTLLHLAAHEKNSECVNLLLNNGADYTIQSENGETALHLVGKKTWFQKENRVERADQSSNISVINSILSAHVKNGNTVNPSSKNGVSHFHIACRTNNIEAVKLFLKAGVPVNLAVDPDSSEFPGFTPLHFAVDSWCLETVEILLSHGADVQAKNAKNMSSLYLLMENYRKIQNDANKTLDTKEAKRKYAAMIDMILKHAGQDFSSYIDDAELTGFHIAVTLGNESLIKNLLKNNVNVHAYVRNDSLTWPGYTALHFAAHFNPKIVEILVENGADILSKDANGATPLDLCLERYSPVKIHSILSAHNDFKDLLLSDNSTKVMDLVLSMENTDKFTEFLKSLNDVNIAILSESPLWPGFSPLHLAIVMSKSSDIYLERIKICLESGIGVNSKSADGATSVRLALNLKNKVLVQELLKYRKREIEKNEVIDEDDSLNFQISCALRDKDIFEQYIKSGIDVNSSVKSCFEWYEPFTSDSLTYIPIGWTPLHIAAYYRDIEKSRILLDQNADPNVQDGNGVTPIHLSMKHYIFPTDNQNANSLLSKDLKNAVTCITFSHLHVAAFANKPTAIEEYLKQGADINAVIQYEELKDFMKELSFLSKVEGFTPLQIAVKYLSYLSIATLLKHGAKFDVENSCSWLNVFHSMTSVYFSKTFLLAFRDTYMSKVVIDEDSNFTILHFACALFDEDMIAESLENGPDVNARINSDSERLWNGYTPLHILMKRIVEVACSGETLEEIMELLLDLGADVTIGDAEGVTPLNLAYQAHAMDGIEFGCDAIGLLLEKQPSYSINPTDANGFSHLHIASAMDRAASVEEFLKNNIDINQSVNPFQKFVGGRTALYFAIFRHAEKVIEKLLQNGADLKMEDFEGNTPLHLVAKELFSDETIVNDMISKGADIHAKNIRFETPFELLLKSNSMRENNVKLFLNLGCRLNDFNPITSEGFIAIALNTCAYWFGRDVNRFTKIIGLDTATSLHENGSNAIHNAVSIFKPNIPSKDYVKAIQKLVEIGCDINLQDAQGKTPLRVAADFKNVEGAKSLISLGADKSITDLEGNAPDLNSFDS